MDAFVSSLLVSLQYMALILFHELAHLLDVLNVVSNSMPEPCPAAKRWCSRNFSADTVCVGLANSACTKLVYLLGNSADV